MYMQARKFAEGIHAKFPGKLLAYNCSPSFNWQKNLGDAEIATFQQVPRRAASAALPRVPLPLHATQAQISIWDDVCSQYRLRAAAQLPGLLVRTSTTLLLHTGVDTRSPQLLQETCCMEAPSRRKTCI